VIEGALLMIELGLFLVLLLKVWRVQRRKEGEDTGFFAYRKDKDQPGPGGRTTRRAGGRTHA
jgi:hypothetical protein